MNKTKNIIYWIARIVAAIIMLQTLFFKFTASPESVYIFTRVGMEPWGRILTGVLELVASVLILISTTTWLGAVIALGLMSGAIMMHLTILGLDVMDDHGQLFIYALTVLICSVYMLWFNKEKILTLIRKITS
jgi:uncharacterized membrane protein YphA (DoxX/SURF4 family)